MAERFERLYSLPNNLYSADSPVIVSAGALLKDNQTGSIVAQLKYQSISSVEIKALRIDIIAYDVSGNEIDGVKNYQYLDLTVKNGQEFGSKTAIILPNKTTRSFSIGKLTAVLADNSSFDISMPLVELPKLKTLQDTLWKTELVKQYKLAINDKAKYVPCESNNLWACSCGNWSQDERCVHCWALKQDVFSVYNVDILSKNADKRLAFEKERKEEEDKRRKEQNRRISIVLSVIAVGLALVMTFNYWIYPNVVVPLNNYKEAEKLFDAEKYSDAAVAFRALGDFKDSKDRVNESLTCINDGVYEHGIQLMQELKYEEAIKKFESIPNHKDSKDKIEEAHICILDTMYKTADTLLSKGEYKEAIDAFTEIVNYKEATTIYKDSLERIEEAKAGLYKNAEVLLSVGKHIDAAMAFGAAGDFKDAQTRSFLLWDTIVGKSRNTFDTDSSHTVAIKNDGTVIATGSNDYGECNISSWTDIIAIATCTSKTLGLKSDGTVVAVGRCENGECNVSNWESIIAIAAGSNHVVGLKSDGTVVATGYNQDGRCNVSTWENIIAIGAGWGHTVGLKADGTVIATGANTDGECNVNNWRDITEIHVNYTNTVGKDEGGIVRITGENDVGIYDSEVFAVYPDMGHTIALLNDGTVLASGENYLGECNVRRWKDIVKIAASHSHTIGQNADGTLVATGSNDDGQCNVSDWINIRLPYQ